MGLADFPGEAGDDGIGAQKQNPRAVLLLVGRFFFFLGGENKHESRHLNKLGREAKLNVM